MNRNTEMETFLRGRKLKKAIDELYKDFRVRHDLKQIEVDVLIYHASHPGESSSNIARSLSLNKGQVSTAMDTLCTRGYMTAVQDPDDRRYVRYDITDKGREAETEIRRIRSLLDEKIYRGFSDADLAVFLEFVSRLNRNLEEIAS